MDRAANAEAAKAGSQYKLLDEAIPARSFAAANPIGDLTDFYNIDMMDMKIPDMWLAERPYQPGSAKVRQWWHSDFCAVALLYI